MIIADTSALLSLATGDVLEIVLTEFDIHTTTVVIGELEDTSTFSDAHAEAATAVLSQRDQLAIHETAEPQFNSSRVETGEASCVLLAREIDPDFVITDDLRALPELQNLVDTQVAISPIVLRALVKRGVLDNEAAKARLRKIAETRDWLGAPIYRQAQQLFD